MVEAVDVTRDGHIYLSTSGGSSASYLMMADKIMIELNSYYGEALKGFHDVFIPKPPPLREAIPVYKVSDRPGKPYVKVPLDKIVAVVKTDCYCKTAGFREPDETAKAIAANIVDFIKFERKKGRLHEDLPFQSGVGNVANAVLAAMAQDDTLGRVSLFTEVIQDSVFELLDNDKLIYASGTALTLSPKRQERFKSDMSLLKDKIVLRQQEISNHPECIRRLGVVAMNTALEFDIFGNVNSTHVLGSKIMNGIGGSGDFTRNGYMPIFMAPSTAKGGLISTIVPMVSHVDHNEHSTKIFVTEQGLADVRGLKPVARARKIIEKCAHPDYRDMLTDYLDFGLKHAISQHTPHVLDKSFDFHIRYMTTGTMKK
jgi:acyl-CoA hydrolase